MLVIVLPQLPGCQDKGGLKEEMQKADAPARRQLNKPAKEEQTVHQTVAWKSLMLKWTVAEEQMTRTTVSRTIASVAERIFIRTFELLSLWD